MNGTASSPPPSVGNASTLPPHLILETEIKRLLYMLPRQKSNAIVLQFIATQSGIGTTSVARDFSVVSGGDMGVETLLISLDGPIGSFEESIVRKYYIPASRLIAPASSASDAQPDGDWLQVRKVKDSSLSIAMPSTDAQKHPIDWIEQIKKWKPRYEVIFIDAPPLRASYLGVALSSYIDASIIVIGAEETKKSEAKDLIYRIEEVKGNILGAVFNKRRSHIPSILYHLPI
ncbi:hypothetical protein HLH26_02410 [Gluconacetobacter sp. 1b LMG 1731]|uniref:Uncharacterized protein n=1 Tax=Gluconacetobacter dulcium TaxID=2729096 RepID=A0A7W4IID3_9PROT|nr:hypothetical protein [Gluconacetobacter dulcium]MBB2163401.1 hypothetical protein [Gluconacetobacter dulcium]MBB2192482.1 hypothetical protein [Gluconacetobacter dulcium]MBB2198175.1 hypothetical protein [Gluconacetobacter dulcium]